MKLYHRGFIVAEITLKNPAMAKESIMAMKESIMAMKECIVA